MLLTDKTPARLAQVSLFFSIANFVFDGINGHSLLLFAVFTLSVYTTTRIFILFNQIQQTAAVDFGELKNYLLVAAVLFIGIATFAYSYLFGVFYLFITGVYFISPYDRDWLAGRSKIVVFENKVEYREV
ncbi:hypothetical protein BTA51_02645 [Hahella sp. CCB-MM4]|uniref:hypothetical protein n=1 Tax=Hahella sp. (strain CCB-MM4) TaxID=1926491 RepID=UPI000B9AAC86|nr:hypothetical protein [Hahella sp. CCB-MM4]OZG75302.1 hypothetical protein BTA51_02645 [Hahella sp. CCB-MM4]